MKTLVCLLVLMMNGWVHAQETLDRVLVVVDKEIILESQVQQELQRYFVDNKLDPRELEPGELEELKLQLVQAMIDSRVMLAVAKADTNIVVDGRTVDKQTEQRIDEIIRQVGTIKRLEEAMGQPLKSIRALIRKDLEERQYIEALQARRLAKVDISRQQVEAFFASHQDSLPMVGESLRLSHIFLEYKVSAESDARARARADSVYVLLRGGADFADLARTFSDDSSAPEGGLIGRTKRGTLVRPYEEAAYRLEEGQVSEPVRSEFGWHVIRLDGRAGDYITSSHILYRLQPTERDREIVAHRADSLHKALEAGSDFATLARRWTDHAQTREAGGDLGWLPIDDLLPLVRSRLRDLPAGGITVPLEGTIDDKPGLQIYQVVERRPARRPSLEQDWEQIRRLALGFRKQELMQSWLEELRADVYIQVMD
jgi:peptidyl-prolyl cis-trans isomerase SurA